MENAFLFGILPLSLVVISSIMICKFFSHQSDILNIVIIHIDKNNNCIEIPSCFHNFSSDIIELDIGYKLNHYHFDYDRRILLLFVKSVEYDICMAERVRKLILPKTNKHILIKENYK